MTNEAKTALLVMCDISGYTQFMVSHRESLAHGQIIITQLIQTLLREAKMPLVVAKLEGDAIFLYCVLAPDMPALQVRDVLAKMSGFFVAFDAKLLELAQSNICPCEACRHTEALRLKILLHVGTALMHRIGRFTELAGTDVILIHRLLKNSLEAKQYLLLTETARNVAGLEAAPCDYEGVEEYDALGEVNIYAYFPPLNFAPQMQPLPKRNYATLWYKTKNILLKILYTRLTFLHLKRRPFFRNLASKETRSQTNS